MVDKVNDQPADDVADKVQDDPSLLNQEPAPKDDDKPEEVKDQEGDDDQEDEDGKADKSDKEKKSDVPEKYEFEFPEGFEVDEDLQTEFQDVAKELGLTQDNAQKLVNMQADFMHKVAEKQQEAWASTTQEWADNAKNDKEFGGEAFDESVGVARKALDAFGSDGLKEVLDMTGAGNHPEVIRAFYKIGKAMAEDKVVTGDRPANAPRDPAKVLFPDMN